MKYSLNKNIADYTFDNRRILITGGAGFIGSNLALYFQKYYPTALITVYDKFRDNTFFENGNPTSFGDYRNLLNFKGEIVAGDITKPHFIEFLKNNQFAFIFHLAAISDTTIKNQKVVLETNLNAFQKILQYNKGAYIIYASSAATYGNLEAPQTVGKEAPENIYGFSKLAMDNFVKTYYPDAPIIGLRYFNVYGKNEFFKEKTSSMVLQFGHQILGKSAPKLFEGSDKIYRDFIYIEDIIQATVKAAIALNNKFDLNQDQNLKPVYNVGTGKARTFQDIADILQKELNTNYGSEYIPNPYIEQYQFFTQANIEDTKQYLSYTPRFSLEAGIKDYIPEIKRIYEEEVK